MITKEIILTTAEQQLTEVMGYPVTLKIRRSSMNQMDRLKDAVCEVFHLTWTQIQTVNKKEERSLARAVFCYIAAVEMDLTLQSIAAELKLKDHTAVMYHRNGVINRMERGERLLVHRYNQVKTILNEN